MAKFINILKGKGRIIYLACWILIPMLLFVIGFLTTLFSIEWTLLIMLLGLISFVILTIGLIMHMILN